MITIENVVTASPEQWMFTINGMRNPKNSWDKSDSKIVYENVRGWGEFELGDADRKLCLGLANGGPVNAKYRRQIPVHFNLIAPLYFWKEFDTYRVGVAPNPTDIEMNSCSTMHRITEKKFTLDDFAHEHLLGKDAIPDHDYQSPYHVMEQVIECLNYYRKKYMECSDALHGPDMLSISDRARLIRQQKDYWWQLIQLLPSSYRQKRSIATNYEALAGMFFWRQGHKQDEWREQFCPWIMTLPNHELITNPKQNPLPKEDSYVIKM